MHAAMERQPAMVCENQMHSCLPGQNGTWKNPQICWRCKGTGAPPPPLPPPPGDAPPPAGGSEGAQTFEIEGVPPGYVYRHTPLPNAQCFNLDTYAKDRKHHRDFIPDLLTDEGTSTG